MAILRQDYQRRTRCQDFVEVLKEGPKEGHHGALGHLEGGVEGLLVDGAEGGDGVVCSKQSRGEEIQGGEVLVLEAQPKGLQLLWPELVKKLKQN